MPIAERLFDQDHHIPMQSFLHFVYFVQSQQVIQMELWMDLLFGNPIGLASMAVIGTTIGLCTFYAVYFILKVRNAKPPVEGH